MLDMSWGEMMMIGVIALIVIGPKDLPKALRTVGQTIGKVRRMAAEFQGQFNEAMREAELDDVKRQIQGINDSVGGMNRGFNPAQTIRDELKGAIEAPAQPAAGTEARPMTGENGGPESLPLPAPASSEPAAPAPAAVERAADEREKQAAMPGEKA